MTSGTNLRFAMSLPRQSAARVKPSPTRRELLGGSPIHRLPVEILAEIFVVFASLESKTVQKAGWTQILLVCKFWYSIACDVASLWKVIHVNPNPDWLRLCLDRAPRCVIDLHIPQLHPRDFNAARHIIVPDRHRIRALHFRTTHDFLTSNVADFLTEGFPALEELTFLPIEWRVKRGTSLGLSADAFPCLRTLVLSGVSIPREPRFYQNLRSFELHEKCSERSGFTIDDLLDALHAASPHLQELDLSRFDPTSSPSNNQAIRQIHLQSLRSLYMENDFVVASELTKHLRVPSNVTLRLRISLPSSGPAPRDTTEQLFAAILPPNMRIAFDSAKELSIHIERNRFVVHVFDSTSSDYQINRPNERRSERVNVGFFGPYTYDDALQAVPTFGVSQRLTVLTVTSPSIPQSVAAWKVLLGAFPLLNTFTVYAGRQMAFDGAVDGAFVGLSRERQAETAASISSSRRTPRCPLLKAINIVCLPGMGERRFRSGIGPFFNIVVECLRSRAGHAGRLETLSFKSFMHSYRTGLEDSYAELGKLVDNVDIL
ncbi:hypothetical protein BD309DRAFT_958926 [Dichomitus squalens]|uniref:F-box domain-containing protein n=1 Tax=Dichomitus squalens TaxID=114155 RepID=A0A4Q9NRP4_9APHY|nr:hypothetical protein BD309DRAFT_958926 [Dichomitus squalens]TBU60097.1 hypothetical protein BD310DRAFT_923323 [Dichomitus squalens]